MKERRQGELALTLGGGGARGAYQVGVLRGLARSFPELSIPVLTGVSAGGINAAHLACHTGTLEERVEELVQLWSRLTVEQVFRVDGASLIGHVARWAGQLLFLGGRRAVPQLQGMVDTAPLQTFLAEALEAVNGELPGIERNLDEDVLRAVAVSSTRYDTGQTVTWCQGRELTMWRRTQRVARETRLRVEHVMASAALPLFFPAVEVDGTWHGDGGIRMHSPLSPAIHLGAERILAISTRYRRTNHEADQPATEGYPPPAQVLGVLMNAIFLDLFDQDAAILQRTNTLLQHAPAAQREGLRKVDFFLIRPSVDLGRLASDYEPRLPGLFRFLTRRLGTRETRNQDLISLVMFQHDYLSRLIEIGERDADAHREPFAAFLGAGQPTSSP